MLSSKELYERWKDVSSFSIFGFGHVCKSSLKEAKKWGTITCIYDNDPEKAGEVFEGVSLRIFDQREHHPREKVLIATHYKAIKQQLEDSGLAEYEDFLAMDKFLTVMNWHASGKIYASELHLSITTKCSLNCKKCNMFMSSYEHPEHLSMQAVKDDLAAMFSKVDYVETLALLGGEPFLYPNLGELLRYIHHSYRDRYGVMELITNGTIEPSRDLLDILYETEVFCRISDYSAAINYAPRLKHLQESLTRRGIPHYSNRSLTWLDFGFPDHPLNLPKEAVYPHMLECSPAFKGVNDEKLYFCHVVWSAAKCGLYKEKETDYFSLNTGGKAELADYLIGVMEAPVGLCKFCAGCADSNHAVIPIAEQAPRKNGEDEPLRRR
ncbi:hypothetical protein TAMA11512_22020 [Selenomonas sp. TAMA-11512]|uniref:radical SAM protein n=1 Tax=Selenomonas sp. TAMA-11512 TaxID=3095337 RepID=UPI003092CEE0|nr:hypothetical protein TAMA11512_22020 [Selenomonas sp. TAMA-11512]